MVAIGFGLALLVVLVMGIELRSLRRRLDLVERHTDYRIDYAMRQIDDLHAYRERANFHRWN